MIAPDQVSPSIWAHPCIQGESRAAIMNGCTRDFTLATIVIRSMQSKARTCRAVLGLLDGPPKASGRDRVTAKDTLPIQPVVSLRSIRRLVP